MDATKRNRSVFVREYVLRTPTNAVEMGKAISWATQDWHKDNPDKTMYDDSLTITADEERIVISYTAKDETWKGQDPPSQT